MGPTGKVLSVDYTRTISARLQLGSSPAHAANTLTISDRSQLGSSSARDRHMDDPRKVAARPIAWLVRVGCHVDVRSTLQHACRAPRTPHARSAIDVNEGRLSSTAARVNACCGPPAQGPPRPHPRPHVREVVVEHVRTLAAPSSTPATAQGSRARGRKSTSMNVDRARSTVIELDHVENPSSIEFIEIHRARSTVIEVDSNLARPSSTSIQISIDRH